MGQSHSEPSSNSNSPVHRLQQQHNNVGYATAAGVAAEDRRNNAAARNDEQPASTTSSTTLLPENMEAMRNEIRKQTTKLVGQAIELGKLNYEEFHEYILELNALSRRCQDAAGKRLIFVVVNGTDRTLLWKGTVRIGCAKVDTLTNRIETHRIINLVQFVRVLRTFRAHVAALESSEEAESMRLSYVFNNDLLTSVHQPASPTHSLADGSSGAGNTSTSGSDSLSSHPMECVICMDRQAEVCLPCTHYYCLPCIEQWKNEKRTCPVCMERLPAQDESWVLTERPDVDEVNDRICHDLMALSKQ